MFEIGKSDFERVYDKYSDVLYRLALSHLRHSEDAEDVVHDVFSKFITEPRKFDSEEYEKAWFIRVTVNCCRDVLRKGKYRVHLSLDEVENVLAEEKTQSTDIIEIVSALPQKYKTVIILHYLEGYSVDEISFMLKLSASAVKMRLSRGRDLLKKRFETEDGCV